MGADGQTATLTYYITNYATKKQQDSSNASALLAKQLAFSKKEDHRQMDLNKLNKKLIQSCANCLSRDQEFSAPEIMTYIMGWLDVYLSHHYVMIYWDTAAIALKRTFPAAMAAILMYEYMATGRHKGYIYRANRLPS